MKPYRLPELLSPAGSPEAFEAAIDGGADAIYVGGTSFNARINARNFSSEDLRAAVKLAHTYGVKVYQTVNIMVYDRELDELLRAAEESADMGMDAFIVSDLGAASLIHRALPEMPLHGSTQMSVHDAAGAILLQKYGFTRVVPARELSKENIETLVRENPLEVEAFIHGALCVSHSGQCLFSSLVGGRSGNRGLCAQPCRLPYCSAEGKCGDRYPLSLKDLSLASHVKEIIESGVASLKIEGRMKSPEYVRGVTKIWRKLLDEGRDASVAELQALSELFSRGGFTDGYYTGSVGKKMLGVRSEEDKQASRDTEKFRKIERKLPLDMTVVLEADQPARLELTACGKSVSAEGDIPMAAISAPLDEENVKKCMAKLGDTAFVLQSFSLAMEERLMMPVSRLNALRREGVEKLTALLAEPVSYRVEKPEKKRSERKSIMRNVGRFRDLSQVTQSAQDFFDVILLPIEQYIYHGDKADGFVFPAVIMDSERESVAELLEKAAAYGPAYAVVSNLGQIELMKTYLPDTKMIADFRFNTANDESMVFLEALGFESVVLSAELTLPQLRDIHGAKAALVYGHLPLMTLEKCVLKALYGEKACQICDRDAGEMKDRKGVVFPVVRESRHLPQLHRNLVLNSLPTCMSDRQGELHAAGIVDRHFLFTAEDAKRVDEVIEAYRNGASLGKVRRI